MKTNEILTGAELGLTNGEVAVAVYPAKKGDSRSTVLTKSGKRVAIEGARIQGVGPARFFQERGFTLASEGDALAAKLADLMDIEDGLKLLEDASMTQASEWRAWLAGRTMKLIPFDPEKPVREVVFAEFRPGHLSAGHLDTGVHVGVMEVDYRPGYGASQLDATQGWILALDEDEANGPRNTEYGGTVELAAYLLARVGLVTLGKERHLSDGVSEAMDAPFPRGSMRMPVTNAELKTQDELVVGITAVDEVEVVYLRDGLELYRRFGITGTKLGKVVGCLAAALVRVREMDADAARVKTKKRA